MQAVIDGIRSLKHLDLRRVSDDERRKAGLQAKLEEQKQQVREPRALL